MYQIDDVDFENASATYEQNKVDIINGIKKTFLQSQAILFKGLLDRIQTFYPDIKFLISEKAWIDNYEKRERHLRAIEIAYMEGADLGAELIHHKELLIQFLSGLIQRMQREHPEFELTAEEQTWYAAHTPTNTSNEA